ncbi:hypothetical protein JVU11DRAFT_8264 [Chiua virens]|nr:hypothetical protein JVU11DRAFT_8264 [Chiua virens]
MYATFIRNLNVINLHSIQWLGYFYYQFSFSSNRLNRTAPKSYNHIYRHTQFHADSPSTATDIIHQPVSMEVDEPPVPEEFTLFTLLPRTSGHTDHSRHWPAMFLQSPSISLSINSQASLIDSPLIKPMSLRGKPKDHPKAREILTSFVAAAAVHLIEIKVTEVNDKVENLKLNATEKTTNGPSYPYYLPNFDGGEKWLPTKIYEHVDPGLKADPAKPHLLTAEAKLEHLSPYLGTEISGIQISQLTEEGLDELALYAAERKVLIFRDQDFKDIGPERQVELAKRFGRIHRHPTSGNVKDYPEFHVVYRDANHDYLKRVIPEDRINQTQWHSDVSYEKQPAGTTFFVILDQPPTGGDTLFASQVEAYNRLSPEFKKRLEGLRAVHSAHEQAEKSRRNGGPVRREPIETEVRTHSRHSKRRSSNEICRQHPLVRRHPLTGEKALYVNPGFTRRIVGFKKEESEYLLNFLYDHISKGADFQIRAHYKPGTVVVWDNRVTVHSALADFNPAERRHAVRLTPQAEVPLPA